MRIRLGICAFLILLGPLSKTLRSEPPPKTSATSLQPTYNGLTGYFYASPDASPQIREDGWGFSVYSGIYPLKPGMDDWTQLGWGTWLLPNPDEDANGVWDPRPQNPDGSNVSFCSPGAPEPDLFQSDEGGVGSWGDVKYPTPEPMFAITATADCYNSYVAGPAYTVGADRALDEKDLYFAQVSNRVLLPPGPIIFENPVAPSLFGYGWIALPIIPANASPDGIPTGTNTWTLFINTANFKGAVGFFTPAFWTSINVTQSPWLSVGYGLDSRNSISGDADMEIGFTNAFSATDDAGVEYRRVPRLTFGIDEDGRATLMQDFQRYFKSAIWDRVDSWMNGGAAPTSMDASGIWTAEMQNPSQSLRMLDASDQIDLGTSVKATTFTTSGGGSAVGLQWDGTLERGVLPEYYKKVNGQWTAIAASQVPDVTALKDQKFPQLPTGTTPAVDVSSSSPWTSAHWAAGPFHAVLENGSVVDYVWYRFVDQPAIARLPLNSAQRAKLQAWAESLHAQGTNGLTIPAPTSGRLVSLSRGEIVTPPPGLERGFVPIAIGQRIARRRAAVR